jgi:hypothetical protein
MWEHCSVPIDLRAALLLAGSIACYSSAYAFQYDVLINPPPQMNARSCQSYSLAVALALRDQTRRFKVDTVSDLRELESEIRLRVQREMAAHRRTDSTREDWRKAIEALTFGDFTVEGKDFPSYEDLSLFLAAHLTIHGKSPLLERIALDVPTTVYLGSFRTVNGLEYRSGHIISILGQELANRRESSLDSLLIINSADRAALCTFPQRPVKYFGLAGWTNDYQLKYFRLDWVAKRN